MTHTVNAEYQMSEDEFIDSIADGDYIFVIDSQGKLKSMLMPEPASMDPMPAEVQQVMGVFDLTCYPGETIH